MPTTGESKEVIDEERIIELKKDKRSRKIAVTKRRHNLDSLRASGGDSELIQDEVDTVETIGSPPRCYAWGKTKTKIRSQ